MVEIELAKLTTGYCPTGLCTLARSLTVDINKIHQKNALYLRGWDGNFNADTVCGIASLEWITHFPGWTWETSELLL